MAKPLKLPKWDTLEDEAKLGRVTEADLEEALNAAPIVDPSDDPDLKVLVGLAGKELIRRFQDQPESLPGTFAIKLYLDGMKAIAAGDISDSSDPGTVDILGSLDALPPEHARMLLRAEIVRLAALLDAYKDTLLGLEGA